MKLFTRLVILPVIASAAFTGAEAAPGIGRSSDAGTLVTRHTADKALTISAVTRYVNVENGRAVRFDVDGRSFDFLFNTWPGDKVVDLADIAPKDIAVPHVPVYIAPNRLYQER
jgi:hypothetical protein